MDRAPLLAAGFAAAQFAALAVYGLFVPKAPAAEARWLAPKENAAKRATEVWFLAYAVVWIGAFAAIVGFALYERFGVPAGVLPRRAPSDGT